MKIKNYKPQSVIQNLKQLIKHKYNYHNKLHFKALEILILVKAIQVFLVCSRESLQILKLMDKMEQISIHNINSKLKVYPNNQRRLHNREFDSFKKNSQVQQDVLQTVYKELDEDYKKQSSQFATIKYELDHYREAYEKLYADLQIQKKELFEKKLRIEQLENAHKLSQQSLIKLQEEYEIKEGQMKNLVSEMVHLQQKNEKLEKLAYFVLINLFRYIFETENNFIQFQVKKMSVIPFDCLIILRKNLTGSYQLEIEMPQNRIIYLASDITDLSLDQNQQDIFLITIRVGKNKKVIERFQSDSHTKKICQILKYQLEKIVGENQFLDSPDTDGKKKGLLKGLKTLFAN